MSVEIKDKDVVGVAYHRNGVSALGFYVVSFKAYTAYGEGRVEGDFVAVAYMPTETGDPPKIGEAIPAHDPRVSVLNLGTLLAGNVHDAYRGDNFAPAVYRLATLYEHFRGTQPVALWNDVRAFQTWLVSRSGA